MIVDYLGEVLAGGTVAAEFTCADVVGGGHSYQLHFLWISCLCCVVGVW